MTPSNWWALYEDFVAFNSNKNKVTSSDVDRMKELFDKPEARKSKSIKK